MTLNGLLKKYVQNELQMISTKTGATWFDDNGEHKYSYKYK